MIFLLGYLGFNNFGDELLAAIVSEQLAIENLARISRKSSWHDYLSFMLQGRKLIILGGIFQDKTSFLSLLYYLFIIALAKLMGKEVYCLAVGIGPLHGSLSRLLTKLVLSKIDCISVRDDLSSLWLQSRSIKHSLGADLAWLLDTNKPIQKYNLQLPEEKHSILVFRKTKELIDWQNYPRITNAKNILLLIMQENDREAALDLMDTIFKKQSVKLIDANEFEPAALISLFREHADYMLSMRYHALVLAKFAGLETEIINIDEKLESCKKDIDACSIDELKNKALKALRETLAFDFVNK